MLVSSGVIRAWQQDMARVRRKREAARKEAARADEGEWMDVDGASEDDNRERLYSDAKIGRLERSSWTSLVDRIGAEIVDTGLPRPPSPASSSGSDAPVADDFDGGQDQRRPVVLVVGAAGTKAENITGRRSVDAGHSIVKAMASAMRRRPDLAPKGATVNEMYTSSLCADVKCRRCSARRMLFYRRVRRDGRPNHKKQFYRINFCSKCFTTYHRDILGASNIAQAAVVLLRHGLAWYSDDFCDTFGFPRVRNGQERVKEEEEELDGDNGDGKDEWIDVDEDKDDDE